MLRTLYEFGGKCKSPLVVGIRLRVKPWCRSFKDRGAVVVRRWDGDAEACRPCTLGRVSTRFCDQEKRSITAIVEVTDGKFCRACDLEIVLKVDGASVKDVVGAVGGKGKPLQAPAKLSAFGNVFFFDP